MELLHWSVANIEALLAEATVEASTHGVAHVTPWMKGWLGRLQLETQMGHEPPRGIGSVGYGDQTSCHIMECAIKWTRRSGSVRHGGEVHLFDAFEGPPETLETVVMGHLFESRRGSGTTQGLHPGTSHMLSSSIPMIMSRIGQLQLSFSTGSG